MKKLNGQTRTRSRARTVLSWIGYGALLISCANMLKGNEITDSIGNAVNNANATKVSITLANPEAGGTITDPGYTATEPVGIPFKLVTSVLTEFYAFNKWTVSGSGAVDIADPTSASTTATVTKAASDIVITANYYDRPAISSTVPSENSAAVLINQRITIKFKNPVNVDSFNLSNLMVQEQNSNGGALSEDVTANYFTGVSAVGATTTGTGITEATSFYLVYKDNTYLDTYYDYTITLKGVESADGIAMFGSTTWMFTTGSEKDTSPPAIVAYVDS